jgi:hypothetical protein
MVPLVFLRAHLILALCRMSFLKNTLKDDKTSQFLVDNLMCGHQSITYPQFLQIFGHDPLPNPNSPLEKKRPMTTNRTRQSVTASDSYKNYMFAQVPNCSRFDLQKGPAAVSPMVRSVCCAACCLFCWVSHVLSLQALVTPAGMQSLRVGRTALARYNDGIFT